MEALYLLVPLSLLIVLLAVWIFFGAGAWLLHRLGMPFKLVAGAAMHTPNDNADMLCVSKDSPVTSLANINGKTVAVSVLKSLEQFG